jgi:DNA repair exonuclease SbcCD ATPase subunit
VKLLTLDVKNFGSHESLHIDFTGGLTLVDGWNYDLQSANGVGKSAYLNSIVYALYGDSVKKLKISELIREDCSSMSTDISLLTKKGEVRILRSRGPNSVKLWINGAEAEGVATKIEDKILDALDLTYNQFVQVCYRYQKSSDRFLKLNDTSKKEFLTSILGLDRYGAAYKITHNKISDLEKKISFLEGAISSGLGELKIHEDGLQRSNDKFLQVEQERIIKLQDFVKRNVQFERTRDASRQALLSEQTKLQEELQVLESATSGNVDKVLARIKSVESELFNIGYLRANTGSVQKMIQDLKTVRLDPVCFSCGQAIPEGKRVDHTLEIDGFERQIREWAPLIAKEEEFQEELKKLKTLYSQVNQPHQENVNRRNAISSRLHSVVTDLRSFSDQESRLKTEEASLVDSYDRILGQIREQARGAQALIEQTRGKLTKLKADKLDHETNISYLEEIKKLFSPTGIRAFIFDGLIETLNQRIDFYLQAFFNGLVKFEYVSDEKTGKFTERLTYGDKERSVAMLSGGEECRLSLAVDLALSDVISTRLAVQPNVLILDEAADGLDTVGRECLMTLLHDLERARDVIFVVDHESEFKTNFSNVIKLELKNGVTSRV